MNPSPKQVASDEQMKVAKDIFGGCTCDLLEGFAWSGKHKRDCVILIVATAISNAVEEETSRCAKVAESWMAVSHEMGRDIAKAIRSKKEVRG